MDAHHHLHIRKRYARLHKKLEPYPARTPWKRVLDKVMLTFGAFAPVVSIPQILLIYVGKDATGVSPLTFFLIMCFNVLWFFYGFAHREVPLMILYALWFVCNALIFVGALAYG